ncbi:DUF4355 domain-containing protein [Enterococcus faecalis]|uniref:capsid assembly scaffolding protein Gp46 family protein n=1 Tax=Bacillota TaxID=1239 RepID=UPI0009FA1286|nr:MULTISPECIES: DUF4355 domain-containing protein [Bacillota]EGO2625190.1 DUF4355 domain-containing protein [Enterococcus faecalis]EGO2723953.1 DUF4355 domain-containing protein [Enterococcus faecalis]EGO5143425.1 DUF4355 domain-containing protein [Enterococcus faecalis]EGO5189963.1 DUF4355 domain-containing protein [Enterococcus faecalis]EGO5804623.1 DUF4355 domain-containing protein [Enterococcus faecalis]
MKTKKLLPMNLQMFADGGGNEPEFTIDDFKAFVESNEDAQKFIQSQSQSAADKQLEAWKQNNLDKLKQEAVQQYEESKKTKTPEQIALEKLQAEFEAEKNLRVTSENKAFVAEQIAGLKLEDELSESVSQFMLNNLVSSDTEFTQKAVESFTGVLSTINEKHAEAIKNMEMTKAFGNKQQTNATDGNQSTQPIENPKEALGQKLQAFN